MRKEEKQEKFPVICKHRSSAPSGPLLKREGGGVQGKTTLKRIQKELKGKEKGRKRTMLRYSNHIQRAEIKRKRQGR